MTTHLPDGRVSDAVKAFRQLTEHDGPAAALTRSRLLTHAPGRLRRRRRAIAGLAVAVILVVLGSVAVARFLAHRWRTDDEARVARAEQSPSVGSPVPASATAAATTTVPLTETPATTPPPADPSAPATPPPTSELALYGAAHSAHFVSRDAARALRLWTQYLRQFPAGRFAPEATYNRALALLRLGREHEALAALRPIAAGRFGSYRRADAAALIAALGSSSE